ncbi:MAG TPA: zf-HC2 domain-containing protein [Rhodothermales bacterium]|nr:zf-HC2 domain-containing protein [Rhodothermales bacterium]
MTTPCTHTDRVDAYLDGDLDPAEAALFARHAEGCAACTAELALAEQVTGLLQAAPCPPCPEPILDAALARIAHQERRASDRGALRTAFVRRPFRTAAFALAASAAIVALALGPALRPAPRPSPAEIAQARADVELAFSLVAESSQQTGVFLRDDVLGPHVTEPAANSILDLLGPAE